MKAGKDSARCEKLQEEIVSRAQGVFLWVFLVVRSLIIGLTNADRVTDLERRLQSLPTDLEAYFRHMLETIEEVYRQQTVQTFYIALQAAEPLSLMTYAMVDELEENPEYAIELPIQQMTKTDLDTRCQDMKLRINARCKDLLQVTVRDANSMSPIYLSRSESLPPPPLSEPQPFPENLPLEPDYMNDYLLSDDLPPYAEPALLVDAPAPENTHDSQIPNGEVSLHPLFQYEVDFLHRTVKDFFQVNHIQTFIASRIPETFNYCSLLCHAFLAQIKVASVKMHHFGHAGELSDLIDDMVHYAHEAEAQTAHSSIVFLDELSNAVQVHRDSLWVGGSMTYYPVQDPSMRRFCQSFLGFAVQRDLQLYVKYKLEERLRHASFEWEHDELVLDALQPSVTSKYGVRSTNKTMLRILVDKGVDLNRSFGQRNVWDHIVSLVCQKWAYSTENTRVHQLENITALLEVGAEPNWSPGPDRLRWVQFILTPGTNWRSRSSEFKAALTKTIVAFCERGIDPYWEFEGYTLWIHLIRSIYDEGQILDALSLETKGFVLVVIRKFMDLGAQLDDMINHDVIKHEDGVPVRLESMAVTDVLTGIFTKTEVEELEHLQRRAGPESSKVKPSRAQRRKEKKRRKERKGDVGTGW